MLLTLFLILVTPPQRLCAEWTLSNVTLPRPDWGTAIAYHNKSVYLAGGESNRHQLVEYSLDQDLFIDHDSTDISYNIWSGGQYYTQSTHILYMVTTDMLAILNLETKQFANHHTMQVNTGDGACVASTSEYILISGGGFGYSGYLDTLQIFNLSSAVWVSNTATLKEKRGQHSCVVHSSTNTLYSIGGQNDLPSPISDDRTYVNGDLHTPLHSIEIISTTNVHTQTWSYNRDNLTSPATQTRCVVYENRIFVLGGWGPSSSKMYVIDVQTGQVSMGMPLVYAVYSLSAVVIHDLLYAFGGFSSATGEADKVQYYNLTNAQTMHTLSPTTNDIATNNTVYTNRAHTMQPIITCYIFCVILMLLLVDL
eukprot:1066842_1